MRLIFGLGNPGVKYRLSRHNIGFMVIEEMAARAAAKLDRRKHSSLFARARIAQDDVWLIQPQTFMNLSGQSVRGWLEELSANPQDLLIVCDDLDQEFGRLRLRKSGGDGGHRGLQSIIESLGTQDFLRLKFGIGRPPRGIEAQEYVLSPFAGEEREKLGRLIERAADCIEALLVHGPAYAMTHYHRRTGESKNNQ